MVALTAAEISLSKRRNDHRNELAGVLGPRRHLNGRLLGAHRTGHANVRLLHWRTHRSVQARKGVLAPHGKASNPAGQARMPALRGLAHLDCRAAADAHQQALLQGQAAGHGHCVIAGDLQGHNGAVAQWTACSL